MDSALEGAEHPRAGAWEYSSQNYKYDQTLYSKQMTQKSKIYRKISTVGKSINDMGAPPFHILDKKDIENEISKIEKKFGMTPEEFHKAWKDGKVHGHEAMKLSYYYEFYKDEYE